MSVLPEALAERVRRLSDGEREAVEPLAEDIAIAAQRVLIALSV